MAWDIKYRPLRFDDVLGQEGTVKVLRARLAQGTAHDVSYIFAGGHGCGKTTLSRILARALLCQNLGEDSEPCNTCDNCTGILDETSAAFVEQDAASRGTVDHVRGMLNDLVFVLPNADKRVYLFDEAHRMSRDAQDVLLKPIEDKKLVCLFCTTEPDKIRGPIRSRCEEYTIRKITRESIYERMAGVLQKEGVEYVEDAVLTVIDHSGGHVRDILNKLEMVAQLGPVTLDAVREYLRLSEVSAYYSILLSLGDPASAVKLIEQVCERVGPEEVSAGLAEAAMNSYRLAHKMFADFVYVDRESAQKVYSMYGDAVIHLAEHFLRSYRTTKTGLICDVVACASGVPSKPAQTQVLVQVPVAPVVVNSESPKTPAPQPAVVATKPAPTVVATTPATEKLEPGVPATMPRGARREDRTRVLTHRPRSSPQPKPLAPQEWSAKFYFKLGYLRGTV